MKRKSDLLFHIYMGLFLAYMIIPLIVMGGAAFNDSRFPSVLPWRGGTLRWFTELWADERMWIAFRNTLVVAVAVAALSVLVGTAAAIVVNNVAGRLRSALYGLMVAPILAPGAVIGISTLLFWNAIGKGYAGLTGGDATTMGFPFSAGLHLSALGQVSFVASFVMLLVLARLQSFDNALEEAALDLGASHAQVLRRILLPHLYPAMAAGAAISFFQSIENFNVTLFTRGNADTLTVYVFSKVRTGVTPTINALAVILIGITMVCAVAYEISRRSKERRERMLAAEAE